MAAMTCMIAVPFMLIVIPSGKINEATSSFTPNSSVVVFVFNGNVINHCSIPNLPDDACVEVPVVADRMGFKTTIAGALPDHLAIMANITARVESLVVEAAMKKSKEMVYQAVYMDPLSSAVCSMEEIKSMCDELFEINREYLGDYK